MNSLKALAELSQIVHGMERDLGLTNLSDPDKRVLLSIVREAQEHGTAKTRNVVNICMEQGVSRPTIFRSLKALTNMGHIEQVQHGNYRVLPEN